MNFTGASLLAGAGPVAKGIGAFSGEVVSELVTEIEKTRKHTKSKQVEMFLSGFDPENENCIRFVVSYLAKTML